MANFNKLPIGQALLNNNNLTVKSIFFGLKKQLVYVPTGSPVKVIKKNYNSDAIAPLRRIIENDSKGLASAVKAFKSQTKPLGNLELDICVSEDKNFVALQLLQFGEEYAYHPITEVAFYEGDQAHLVSTIL